MSFTRLPREISQEIWKIAVLQESQERLVVVSDDCRTINPHGSNHIGIPTILPLRYLVSPFLTINCESRRISKAFYNVQLKVYSPSAPRLPTSLRDRAEYNARSISETLVLMRKEAITEADYQEIYQDTQEELCLKYNNDQAYYDKFRIEDGCRYAGPKGYDNIVYDWTKIAKAKSGPSRIPGDEKGIVQLNPEYDTFVISPRLENWRFLVEPEQVIPGPRTKPVSMGLYSISEPMPKSICRRVRKVARLDYVDEEDTDDFFEGNYVWGIWAGVVNPETWPLDTTPMPIDTHPGQPARAWQLYIFKNLEIYLHAFVGEKDADSFLPDVVASSGRSPHKLCKLTLEAIDPEEEGSRSYNYFLTREFPEDHLEAYKIWWKSD